MVLGSFMCLWLPTYVTRDDRRSMIAILWRFRLIFGEKIGHFSEKQIKEYFLHWLLIFKSRMPIFGQFLAYLDIYILVPT
jgi:hypothetical protein